MITIKLFAMLKDKAGLSEIHAAIGSIQSGKSARTGGEE